MEPDLPRANPSAGSGPPQDHLYAWQLVQQRFMGSLSGVPIAILVYSRRIITPLEDICRFVSQLRPVICRVLLSMTHGIFAMQKTGHWFSVPVHVQRKAWGKLHQVRCELEECVQYQLLAQWSG